MKYYETLSFLSLPIDENSREFEWFKNNVEPTYRDVELKEHLYSVDAFDNPIEGETQELPEFIDTFLSEVKAVSSDVAYIRFVNF